jgi:hypothetical protein
MTILNKFNPKRLKQDREDFIVEVKTSALRDRDRITFFCGFMFGGLFILIALAIIK